MEQYKAQLEKAIDWAVETGFERYGFCRYVNKRRKEAEKICLYGAGRFLEDYVEHMDRVDFICDSNPEKWGREFAGHLCISPQQLYRMDGAVVFIMAGHFQEIMEELRNNGVECYYFGDLFFNVYDSPYPSEWFQERKEIILDTLQYFEDEKSKQVYTNVICNRIAPQFSKLTFHEMEEQGEYFDTGILDIGNKECFADIGAYNGDSIRAFIRAVKGRFEAVYGFELDSGNYEKMLKDIQIAGDHRITLFQKGVSDISGRTAIMEGGSGSHIVPGEMGETELVRLDDILSGRKVTFIKMDIEGAEKEALAGAAEIITGQRPKLAVSVYHKLDDMWEIPRLLKRMCPSYKMFLRHHTAVAWDTDCYAYAD